MSRKFNIKPPNWPKEYSFEEFKKLKYPTNQIEKSKLGLDEVTYFSDMINQVYRHYPCDYVAMTDLNESSRFDVSVKELKESGVKLLFSKSYIVPSFT